MPIPVSTSRSRSAPTRSGLAALFAAALLSTWGAPAVAQSPVLYGTATYVEPVGLPENSMFEATILDVTPTGRAPELIGRVTVNPIVELPVRFAIPYDPNLVTYGHSYTIEARMVANGRLLFATTAPAPVLVDGQPVPVDLILAPSSGPSVDTLPSPTPVYVPPTGGSGTSNGTLGAMPASFTGVFPCADCSGIRHDLELSQDGRFALRTAYLGRRGDPSFMLRGYWRLSPSGILTLSGDGEAPLAFAVKSPSTLRLLDATGQEIVSNLNYDLTRTAAAPQAGPVPLPPPAATPSYGATPTYAPPPAPPAPSTVPGQRLRGMYRSDGTQRQFFDCGGDQEIAIAPQGDAALMESAYQHEKGRPGQEILVDLIGRIDIAPRPDGNGLGRVLTVERFLGLRPTDTCGSAPSASGIPAFGTTPGTTAGTIGSGGAPVALGPPVTLSAPGSTGSTAAAPAATDAPLRNTYWKLTRIGSQPLQRFPGQPDPHLILNPDIPQFSGSAGCNGIGGRFVQNGSSITLSLGPSTQIACSTGMEREQAFLRDLDRVRAWSIIGNQLSLSDAYGTNLLTFEATYR